MRTNLVIFGYAFQHRRTQDFIVRAVLEGFYPTVIAAPWCQLPVAAPQTRWALRKDALPAKQICAQLDLPYYEMPHADCAPLLAELQPIIGLIAGARILPASVITPFKRGLLNLHPGLLPDVRGNDPMLWTIHTRRRPAVTAHFIDANIDCGCVVRVQAVPLYPDDTIFDLHERLHDTQLALLGSALTIHPDNGFKIHPTEGTCFRKMPADLEKATVASFGDYLKELL